MAKWKKYLVWGPLTSRRSQAFDTASLHLVLAFFVLRSWFSTTRYLFFFPASLQSFTYKPRLANISHIMCYPSVITEITLFVLAALLSTLCEAFRHVFSCYWKFPWPPPHWHFGHHQYLFKVMNTATLTQQSCLKVSVGLSTWQKVIIFKVFSARKCKLVYTLKWIYTRISK